MRPINIFLFAVLPVLFSNISFAETKEKFSAYEHCLLKAMQSASDSMSLGSLRRQCTEESLIAQKKVANKAARPAREGALRRRLAYEAAHDELDFVITPHKPTYVLPLSYNTNLGALNSQEKLKQAEMKFQFSFKAPIVRGLFAGHGDLYFAYTNQSYWQAYNTAESSPFRETNHEPEAFLLFKTPWDLGLLNHSALALGISHQSNGRSGIDSRSWNRLYANFIFSATDNLYFSLKPWWRIPEDDVDDDNPDIHKYMGYGEFRTFYKLGKHNLGLMLRNNLRKDDNRGAVQLDWSFPISKHIRGYVQYFNGYGESLIDYNESVNRLGIGFMLTDRL